MENNQFEQGDKVVLKNDNKIVYIFIKYINNDTCECLHPNTNKVTFPIVALEKYQPPSFVGGMY